MPYSSHRPTASASSLEDRPVLDGDPDHRGILDVGRFQCRVYARSGSSYQAVSLLERDALPSERAVPRARPNPFGDAQARQSQAVEQVARDGLLIRPAVAPDLFHRDHARPRLGPGSPEGSEASGGRPAAKSVDKPWNRAAGGPSINQPGAGPRDSVAAPTLRDRRPTRGPYRAGRRGRLRCRPSAVSSTTTSWPTSVGAQGPAPTKCVHRRVDSGRHAGPPFPLLRLALRSRGRSSR